MRAPTLRTLAAVTVTGGVAVLVIAPAVAGTGGPPGVLIPPTWVLCAMPNVECGPPAAAPTGSSALFLQVSAGDDHTCGLTLTRGVECWGDNDNGQLGDGTLVDSAIPVRVRGLSSDVGSISAGGDHTCALRTDATVLCWGDNQWGSLGNGAGAGNPTAADSDVPVRVSAVAGALSTPLTGVASIDAGGQHTCAILTTGTAVCWGHDNRGQLGNDATKLFRARPSSWPR